MKLREFATGPELPKKMTKGTLYVCAGSLFLGALNFHCRLDERIDLESQAETEAKALYSKAAESVRQEVSEKLHECKMSYVQCKADVQFDIDNASNEAESIYMDFFSAPGRFSTCAEQQLSCVRGIKPDNI